MTRALLFLLATAITFSSFAQQVAWLHSDPVDYQQNPQFPTHLVRSSPNGFVYDAHVTVSRLISGQDILGEEIIDRRDATGQAIWSFSLGDTALVERMAVDDQGDLILGGRYMGTLNLNNADTLSGTAGERLFLVSLDLNGAIRWKRDLYPDHPLYTTLETIAVDHAGNAWLALSDFTSSSVIRLDALGQEVETRPVLGAKRIGGMAFDPAGAMYIAGAAGAGDDLQFGSLTTPVAFPYAMFVLRYNSSGQGSWARLAHDVTFQQPNVECDPFGNAIVAGALVDSSTFGTFHFHGPDLNYDTFIAKVDSTGQFLWGREASMSGDPLTGELERAKSTCIATDNTGRAFLAGTVHGAVDWGNNVVSDGLALGTSAFTVVCFDGGGSAAWALTSDPTDPFIGAQDITSDASGVLHFAAHLSGEFTFPPLSANIGGMQAFCAGRIDQFSAGLVPIAAEGNISAFPSPFTDHMRLVLPNDPRDVRVRATDASGRVVFDGAYTGSLGTGWMPGLYALTVRSNGVQRTLRVVKE